MWEFFQTKEKEPQISFNTETAFEGFYTVIPKPVCRNTEVASAIAAIDSSRSSKEGEQLTVQEKIYMTSEWGLGRLLCPDCGGSLRGGPQAGDLMNISCPNCGSEFSESLPSYCARISNRNPDKWGP